METEARIGTDMAATSYLFTQRTHTSRCFPTRPVVARLAPVLTLVANILTIRVWCGAIDFIRLLDSKEIPQGSAGNNCQRSSNTYRKKHDFLTKLSLRPNSCGHQSRGGRLVGSRMRPMSSVLSIAKERVPGHDRTVARPAGRRSWTRTARTITSAISEHRTTNCERQS
jgi:hypothetical protein